MWERDNEMKNRRANQLSSNVLTHDDENVRNERFNGFDNSREAKISGTASNANWSAQTGYQKPINAGGVDAYRMR